MVVKIEVSGCSGAIFSNEKGSNIRRGHKRACIFNVICVTNGLQVLRLFIIFLMNGGMVVQSKSHILVVLSVRVFFIRRLIVVIWNATSFSGSWQSRRLRVRAIITYSECSIWNVMNSRLEMFLAQSNSALFFIPKVIGATPEKTTSACWYTV